MLIVANCNFHNKANSFLTKSVGAQKNSFGQSIFTCIYKIYQPGWFVKGFFQSFFIIPKQVQIKPKKASKNMLTLSKKSTIIQFAA